MQIPGSVTPSELYANMLDVGFKSPLRRDAPPSCHVPPSAGLPSPKPLPHTLQALFHPLNALCSVLRYLKSPITITLALLRLFLFALSFHSPVVLFGQVDYKILR